MNKRPGRTKKVRDNVTPPDVVEMAIAVKGQFADKFAKHAGDGYCTGIVACELAAAAIMAERERCKDVAAVYEHVRGIYHSSAYWIGEAIRNGAKPDEVQP